MDCLFRDKKEEIKVMENSVKYVTCKAPLKWIWTKNFFSLLLAENYFIKNINLNNTKLNVS